MGCVKKKRSKKQLLKKCKCECDSLTSLHKTTLDELT